MNRFDIEQIHLHIIWYHLINIWKNSLVRNIANQACMLTEKSNKFLKRILDRLIKISMMPEIIFDFFKECRHSTVVVQRFCKPKVAGSNPAAGTISPFLLLCIRILEQSSMENVAMFFQRIIFQSWNIKILSYIILIK